MFVSAATQSPNSASPSYFERFVRLAKDLPTYAQKTVKSFDNWYLAQGPYLIAAFPIAVGMLGYTYQIPWLETVVSLSFSYMHSVANRYSVNGQTLLAKEAVQEVKALANGGSKEQINSLIRKGSELQKLYPPVKNAVDILKTWEPKRGVSEFEKVSSIFEQTQNEFEFRQKFNRFGMFFWPLVGPRPLLNLILKR